MLGIEFGNISISSVSLLLILTGLLSNLLKFVATFWKSFIYWFIASVNRANRIFDVSLVVLIALNS